ncbi:MAG TPA: GMC oxidoreductase, partial [Xanthobacteraceae bacterium]
VRRRPNLQIVTGATASRIVLEGRRAVGVEIRRGDRSETIRAAEIIVSAGGVHSPALLLRSGIGQAAELRALGINVAIDRRGVGRGLQNHGVVNLTTRLEPAARQARSMRTYGIASARVSSHAAGAPAGDLHLQFIAQLGDRPHGNRLGILGAALYAPFSRGSVSLRSGDASAMPVVDFRFLSDPLDRTRMRQVVRLGLDLLADPAVAPLHGDVFAVIPSSLARQLNSPGWRNRMLSSVVAALLDSPPALRRHALRRVGHLIEDDGSGEMIESLLDLIMPMFHPTGTCRFGRADDPDAVVDPHCRVHGIGALRVIDASVMPVIPRGNTCIPTMMVAERAAELMRGETAQPETIAPASVA